MNDLGTPTATFLALTAIGVVAATLGLLFFVAVPAANASAMNIVGMGNSIDVVEV